ncbi:cation transporter [Ruegeria arenilitoris]|uniref:cation transporter n=1 Tax=Ruegeria arenilitoris TaxID=1173585 RepID=UPI00147A77BB|nr:cation transporter [Ruegeria arenilitoris]
MSRPTRTETQLLESRALTIGMVGNLFMAMAGIVAAYLSNSQAVLMDGLFSFIGFTAAFLGKRVTRNAQRKADKYRPFGYASDEAIFKTFRSLSLLGLVIFAMTSAILNIVGYLNGEPQRQLIFAPMLVYFALVGMTCLILWSFHRRAWIKSGKQSDVLQLEQKAAAFDALITGSAAVGLLGIHAFRDWVLAPIAPIGDSIIVLLLCLSVTLQYYRDFIAGLGELAGVTASPQHIASARRAIRESLRTDGGLLVDLSISKLGRYFTVMVYYDPQRQISAAQIDDLTRQLQADIAKLFEHSEVFVVVSQHGRVLSPG